MFVILLAGLSDNSHVVLQVETKKFQEFIGSILGKPQTIRKLFRGPFRIELSNIENLHALIEQRIEQQNTGNLVQFTARIFYDDSSSVLLNSLEELRSYNEVKPIVSVGVHLSWTYLVQFQDKDSQEKQEIQVTFLGSNRREGGGFDDDEIGFMFLLSPKFGRIQLQINHTARTWGGGHRVTVGGIYKIGN